MALNTRFEKSHLLLDLLEFLGSRGSLTELDLTCILDSALLGWPL